MDKNTATALILELKAIDEAYKNQVTNLFYQYGLTMNVDPRRARQEFSGKLEHVREVRSSVLDLIYELSEDE